MKAVAAPRWLFSWYTPGASIVNGFRRFLLRVPIDLHDEMLRNYLNELPNECCGLLAGRTIEDGYIAQATRHYPLRNELQSPTEYCSDPREMLDAEKDMRARGIEKLAVYHSHPTTPQFQASAISNGIIVRS